MGVKVTYSLNFIMLKTQILRTARFHIQNCLCKIHKVASTYILQLSLNDLWKVAGQTNKISNKLSSTFCRTLCIYSRVPTYLQ